MKDYSVPRDVSRNENHKLRFVGIYRVYVLKETINRMYFLIIGIV